MALISFKENISILYVSLVRIYFYLIILIFFIFFILFLYCPNRPKIGFQDQLLLKAGQKYCRMLEGIA